MTLTNYWWLLIWLFAGAIIMKFFPKRRELLNGQFVERWDYLPAILLIIPFIIWAGYRSNNFGDTFAYRYKFLNFTSDLGDIPSFYNGDTKDPGFAVLQVVLKNFIGNNDDLFFLIIATFQMVCISLTFRKFSSHYWTCIFLFIASTDYMSWMFNGMRQFIAVVSIFACLDLIIKKKYIPLILIILLVSQIHGSALLMIPIVFIVQGKAWSKESVFLLFATIVLIGFIDEVTPVLSDLLMDTQYDDVLSDSTLADDDGTNLLRVAVYSAPAILSLIGLRHVRMANDPLINICVNCSIVTMSLYLVASVSSGIYIGRLPIYTTLMGYIAVPWLINRIFSSNSAKLVTGMMIAAYLVFFYYQMHVTWRLL